VWKVGSAVGKNKAGGKEERERVLGWKLEFQVGYLGKTVLRWGHLSKDLKEQRS
jgi:hypothetical protein